MKWRRLVRPRVGMGIPELVVSLLVMGIIGIAAIKMFISQARFADLQHKRRLARSVSRTPINLLLSEMRMADNIGGVAAASDASGASSITVRVPIAMGLVCGQAGGETVLSMTSAGAATCAAANITTLPGGRVVSVTPLLPAPASIGTPAFLYQRVRFSFAASTMLPGRRGLWRTLEATGATEEVAAPFDSVSRFRFYRNSNDTADVVVPPLDEISGVELVLTGASEQAGFGKTAPEAAPLRTAVFFVNRLN